LAAVDRKSAIEQIASLTSKSVEQIEGRLPIGQRRRVKSSDSLSKLLRLEAKFRAAGFDVYIDKQ
jgi:hypothetical protein